MENKLQKLFLSQNSLSIFNQCKMKFKKRYIDGLYWKSTVSDSEDFIKTEKGRLFHLLAYRYLLGMDCGAGSLNPEYKELDQWIYNLKNFMNINKDKTYYPEYELKLNQGEFKLQAKYDLIAIDPEGNAVIYDWKVQEKPLDRKYVENAFQTIIYRYLLTKTGEIVKGQKMSPENISMVYWQPTHPSGPIKIDYSQELYEKDEKFLRDEVNKILNFDFKSSDIKTEDMKLCRYCEYCAICNDITPDIRDIEVNMEPDFEWDEVAEIEF